MKLAAGSVSIGLGLITLLCAPPMSASCDSGPDSCVSGYVWRRAFPGDHVCVPPASRDRARTDNALAGSRRSPNGGPYGPDTCTPGYVWREASPADHVCVPGDTRQETWNENALAKARRDPSCAPESITQSRDVVTAAEQFVSTISRTVAVIGITVLALIALAITYIADFKMSSRTKPSIAPKAVASLFYALVAWPWPLATGWENYVAREHGSAMYRAPLPDVLMNEVTRDPFVSIGIAGCSVLAIMLGRAALRQIRASPRRWRGTLLAQTGRTLGFVVLIPLLICWTLFGFLMITLSGLAH